jgi:hypothetical protein
VYQSEETGRVLCHIQVTLRNFGVCRAAWPGSSWNPLGSDQELGTESTVDFGWIEEQMRTGRPAEELARRLNANLSRFDHTERFSYQPWLRCAMARIGFGRPTSRNQAVSERDLRTSVASQIYRGTSDMYHVTGRSLGL